MKTRMRKKVVAVSTLPEKRASVTLMKLPGINVAIAMSTREILQI